MAAGVCDVGIVNTYYLAGMLGDREPMELSGRIRVLQPGQAFEYTSGTPLSTPSGFMRGTYHMVAVETGEAFDVEIPGLSLDSPHQPGAVH